ncbi:MAG: hypothetical protein HYU66_06555 [Armatimonadetes bacterium]|nr:hypothetical protein [Armatimonadota bacterium]
MPFPQFDRRRLLVQPLAERVHDMGLQTLIPLDADPPCANPRVDAVAAAIVAARAAGRSVILMMGAHVIKVGLSLHVIDLLERGFVTHVAMNGAGPIHDYELALVGGSTESVARYIRTGEFGLWRETGELNDIVKAGYEAGLGYGESVGRAVEERGLPHRQVSIAGCCHRLGIPLTVHIGIGYDILHEHPNCDGAALGGASYRDFLIFTEAVTGLEGGVLLCFGSAVMGPEVYLKALAMARNLARQEGRTIARFTTAVFDLVPLGDDLSSEAPKDDPRYYYRPFKTILVRTVRDGGTSYYVEGDHMVTLPHLRRRVLARAGGEA